MLGLIFHRLDEALIVFNQFGEWAAAETTCGNFCFAESPLTNFAAADNFNNNSETPQNYQGKQQQVQPRILGFANYQLSFYWTFCWGWKDNEGIIERGSALKLGSKWIEQNDKLASGSGWCKIEAAIVWVKFEQTCLNLVQSTFMWNSDCRWYNIDCELWQTTSLGKLV